MAKILESLDARVQKIVVTDVRDNTFCAVIHLRLGNAPPTSGASPRTLPRDDEWTVTTPTELAGPGPTGVSDVGVHPGFRIAPPAGGST